MSAYACAFMHACVIVCMHMCVFACMHVYPARHGGSTVMPTGFERFGALSETYGPHLRAFPLDHPPLPPFLLPVCAHARSCMHEDTLHTHTGVLVGAAGDASRKEAEAFG